MELCDRRRKLIDDSFFDEGYQESLKSFKTLTVSIGSNNKSSYVTSNNKKLDNDKEFRCSVYRCNQSFASMAKVEHHTNIGCKF